MNKIKHLFNQISKHKKIYCLIFLLILTLITITIPTLARFKNRTAIDVDTVWDGSTATSYRNGTGTETNPYIISNGSELAYFASELATNNYENTYFQLNNNIVLNKGVFDYNVADGITYKLNSTTYYLNNYDNKYYDNSEKTGTEIGSVNLFNSLTNFKGHFDGGLYTIYGLYITNNTDEELALFTNLQGTISNLYVSNSLVFGGAITGGISGTSSSATITNTMFSGNVVGNSTSLSKTTSSNIDNVSVTEDTVKDGTITVPHFYPGTITGISISGNCAITETDTTTTTVSINGTQITGDFTVDLGTTVSDIPVSITSSGANQIITLSNLVYKVTFDESVTSGISAIGNSLTLNSTINKGNIYGINDAAGLVGYANTSLNINTSYNKGAINGVNAAGIVSTLTQLTTDSVIDKTYNAGTISGTNASGLITNILNNTNSLTLTNVMSTTDNNVINNITSSTVNSATSYYIGENKTVTGTLTTDGFTLTTLSALETSKFPTTIGYTEYVDETDRATNNSNMWIYEDSALPILYFDDIASPLGSIYVGSYSWNNYSTEVKNINFGASTSFAITQTSTVRPIKQSYYYISNSSTPLTKTELENVTWTSYTGSVDLNTEGIYIVYAKMIDENNDVSYANSDIIVMDLTGVSVNINNTWTTFKSDLTSLYINTPTSYTITAADALSGVKKIEYYISDVIMTKTELNNLPDTSWTLYSDSVNVSKEGNNIIYVKATDNCDAIAYANTDYIVLDGYSIVDFNYGLSTTPTSNYITSKSSVSFDIGYTSNVALSSSDTHNIISTILLPKDTKITLIDKKNSSVYEYTIPDATDNYNYNDSCSTEGCTKVATYPLSLFKDQGKATFITNLDESTYHSTAIDESFRVVVDFSNADITTDYSNVNIYMDIKNTSEVRSTLASTMHPFNIIYKVNDVVADASINVTTDYTGSITFNSNSTTNVNVTNSLDYKTIDTNSIIDTTYEDKIMGLTIKMIDSSNNVITRDKYKNIKFIIGDNTYYPDTDNITRINLANNLVSTISALKITASADNINLDSGTYYFVINGYASYDGINSDSVSTAEVRIPVTVGNSTTSDYLYDVIMDDTNKIIKRSTNTATIPFDIVLKSKFKTPTIRVSLYKKNSITAYNQDYTKIDLATFMSNTLDSADTNEYYITQSPTTYNGNSSTYNHFDLNLLTYKFDNTGYKLVFDLYDGTNKISSIEKNIVVK